MEFFGKLLLTTGLVLVLVGLILTLGQHHLSFLGRLPGDIRIERENFRFYFPLTSCVLVSLLLSLLLYALSRR
ncbi:MAG: DUF2905 domain-containing protein [candidate division KSB1 bacterium]|nr:DUF2905 domain-containing protein [candidate division KSB1 bacterium]